MPRRQTLVNVNQKYRTASSGPAMRTLPTSSLPNAISRHAIHSIPLSTQLPLDIFSRSSNAACAPSSSGVLFAFADDAASASLLSDGGTEIASDEWTAVVVLVATSVRPNPGDLKMRTSVTNSCARGTRIPTFRSQHLYTRPCKSDSPNITASRPLLLH